jgi:phosphoribosylglycinamide formyltransferase-1
VKKKVLFLVSGGGGNLKFIHQVALNGLVKRVYDFELEVIGCVADRDCEAMEYCIEHALYAKKCSFRRDDESNTQLLSVINGLNADVIITNVHRVLSPVILSGSRSIFLNLHYSLLPAFSGLIGMEPIELAKEKGCRFVGTTCHIVEEEVDAGLIISQTSTHLLGATNISQEIFDSGCLNLLNGILQMFGARLEQSALRNGTFYSPSMNLDGIDLDLVNIYSATRTK